MNIMVVGGGGREHAIIRKLKENSDVKRIFALPGNGGISYDAECVAISATDLDGIVDFASRNSVDFAIIGPDNPLVMGAVDRLQAAGIPTFGPAKDAAILEGSKAFSKELMKKYGIPTATYETFDSPEDALVYLNKSTKYPIVIQADGLALGKGVIIAEDPKQAEEAVHSIMVEQKFGDSGNLVVIEEFLSGKEVSVLAFTDAKTLIPMVSSMDHKRVFDGDAGPNTGGMGTIAPNPYYTEEIAGRCMEEIFLPTLRAMNQEKRPFKGCLYFGLILTLDGPKVIEYNCRFGDPEAQVVLPLLSSDLLSIMQAVVEERLDEVPVVFSHDSACCVVAASGGYPGNYETGLPISGLTDGQLPDKDAGVVVFHAGTSRSDGHLVTSGGRVLGVTAKASSLSSAVLKAYQSIEGLTFLGMHFRRDIGRNQ
jgi:phosphoribosylamine--glycine ligase